MTTKRIIYTRPDGGVSVLIPMPGARRKVLVSEAVYADVKVGDRATGLLDEQGQPMTKPVLERRMVAEAIDRDETDDEFMARLMVKDVPAGATDITVVDAADIPSDRTDRHTWRIVDGGIQVVRG